MNAQPAQHDVESSVNWVNSKKLSELTGMTVKAIDRKRQRGVWTEGVHFIHRDGRIFYSIEAYNQWVAEPISRGLSNIGVAFVSAFPSKANAAERRLAGRRPRTTGLRPQG